jgi:hypothetical protein
MKNPFESVALQETPTPHTFNEQAYLAVNPDVAESVRAGKIRSGWSHFKKFGHIEGRRQKVADDEPATPENFDEARYLAVNADVRQAIELGQFASGRAHFDQLGCAQGRRQRRASGITAMRAKTCRSAAAAARSRYAALEFGQIHICRWGGAWRGRWRRRHADQRERL